MNKIGLAAINYDASPDSTTSGFPQPGQLSVLRKESKGGYSDSEEEGEDASGTPMFGGSMQSLTSISSVDSSSSYVSSVSRRPHVNNGQVFKKLSLHFSSEVLRHMIDSIHHLDLTIDGKDKTQQRQSRCTVTQKLPGDINRAEVGQVEKTAKELELQEIESLLKKPVSVDELYRFVETHNLQPQHMQTYL
ncbi:unnamed protein product [Candidula unifasciata]|uniref:Uncharacterized protein n=1 Tax=Candidula unifasciata TaxID=100452 RepID=A0A8S3YYX5_9EUPU|nr:unnamed protein product [Candidula unifasciata]